MATIENLLRYSRKAGVVCETPTLTSLCPFVLANRGANRLYGYIKTKTVRENPTLPPH